MNNNRELPYNEQKHKLAQCWIDFCDTFFVRKKDYIFGTDTVFDVEHMFKEVKNNFVDKPDVSGSSFYAKLDKQFGDSNRNVKMFFMHIHFVYLLLIHDKDKRSKLQHWSKNNQLPNLPSYIVNQLEYVNAKCGISYHTGRYHQHIRYIELFQLVFNDSSNTRVQEKISAASEKLINDDKKYMLNVSSILKFLGDTDKYEPIVAYSEKCKIYQHYNSTLSLNLPILLDHHNGMYDPKIDEGLKKIKETLCQRHNIPIQNFHFYLDGVYGEWNGLLYPDEISDEALIDYHEGVGRKIYVNVFERNARARAEYLKTLNDYSCVVCGFNFESRYGSIGKKFIHVHHVVPLSKIKSGYTVNPLTDLVAVCPNCHAMLHKKDKNDAFSVKELQQKMSEAKETKRVG